jgi:hypothetical protein
MDSLLHWIMSALPTTVSETLGIVGLVVGVVALIISLRTAYTDRISSNSWEVYHAYHGKDVRRGRALALRIKRETNGMGLPTYAAYQAYFGLDTAAGLSEELKAERLRERQHLHDLATFYHQTGLLLKKRHLDEDFTLLLVGPGLDDRWAIMQPLAGYYETEADGNTAFPYGGMYLLHQRYLRWKRTRFARFRRAFVRARRAK